MVDPISEAPAVSVIVVSRGRPDLLRRCLTGVGQLWYPAFEIVVVADGGGCDAVRDMGWDRRVKLVRFDDANISAARNKGIAVAAGEVVAFIDDDAVPEPTWLAHLAGPFSNEANVQTGGYVRGRNGFSFQWRARVVTRLGDARDVATPEGNLPFSPHVADDEAIKTEGTNMAFRRNVLADLGGFDPAFRFYLDETDVNMRLAGRATVLVPLAEVHHGFAASERRAAHRGTRDLYEVGASTAVFLRKHAAEDMRELGRNRAFLEQKARLIEQMVLGTLSPDAVAPTLASFDRGYAAGLARDLPALHPLGPPDDAFRRFEGEMSGRSDWLAGRVWHARRLAKRAKDRVAQGDVITVLRLSPTALTHRLRFHPDGYWEQRGGLFGRSDRAGPWFSWMRFDTRVQKERARVAHLRTR